LFYFQLCAADEVYVAGTRRLEHRATLLGKIG
jgi:hypothetical protein